MLRGEGREGGRVGERERERERERESGKTRNFDCTSFTNFPTYKSNSEIKRNKNRLCFFKRSGAMNNVKVQKKVITFL